MSRRTLLVRLVGATVGIVAIALAAATIENPLETGGSGGTGGEGGGAPPQNTPVEGNDPGPVEIPAFLEYLLLAIVVVLAIAFAWYLVNHRREAVKSIAIGLAILLGVVTLPLLIDYIFTGATVDPPPPPEMVEQNESGAPGSGDGEGTIDLTPIGSLFIALVAVAAVFVGALVLSERDSDSAGGTLVTDGHPADDAAAVAAAAGRAAERIESGGDDDVDNEVYRAWRDMTRLLEVERPETSTPGEFAAAATDAGLDRDHVDELTRLFEDVRYGHAETTAELEARAVSTLRRIEDEYADVSDDPGPVDDTRGDRR